MRTKKKTVNSEQNIIPANINNIFVIYNKHVLPQGVGCKRNFSFSAYNTKKGKSGNEVKACCDIKMISSLHWVKQRNKKEITLN